MTKRSLAIYSAAHFWVDLSCAFLLFRTLSGSPQWMLCLLLYNFCAFALQMPLGLLADRWNRNGLTAAAGCVLTALACLSPVPLLTAVRLYYGAVLLSFLFGFTAIGTLVIPAIAGTFGFTSMFAIACFVQVYGRGGAVLALGALGVRLVFTLPCFLWLGSYAWQASSSLLPWPRGKRCAPVFYDGSCFYRLFVCVVLLMIGVCFERYITPNLFHLALGVLTEPVLAG